MELKPCPFCGGEAEPIDEKEVYTDTAYASELWIIECKICQASTSFQLTKEDAINSWNHRTEENNENL